MPEPFASTAESHEYSQLLGRYESLRFRTLTQQLVDGQIKMLDWHIGMREELRQAFAMQLICAANGDQANVDPNDWLRLGPMLKSQYRYLEKYAREIQAGKLTDAQILARSELYARSGQVSYWRQRTKEYHLPEQPGERCAGKGNCGCEWVFVEEYDDDGNLIAVDCYWKRSKADSCEVCIDNERKYNPYRVEL